MKPPESTHKPPHTHEELQDMLFIYLFQTHVGANVRLSSCFFSVFNQGEEGTSWYIIQKGSVNVVIYGKVCVSTGM